MKKLKCWIVMLMSITMVIIVNAADFEYDAGDIEGSKSSTGISYTLSVTKGNLGTSMDFDTKDGVTSGSPNGIDISVSSGGATGTVEYTTNSLPTSNFTISMNGKLIPTGSGSGSQPTWSATGNAQAPFWVEPKTQTQIGDNPSVVISASKTAQWTGIDKNKKDIRIRVKGDKTGTADLFVENGAGVITATAVDTLDSDQAQYFICKHGEWSLDVGTLNFSMPTEGINKINTIIGKIPGMNGKKLSGIGGEITGKIRDFCCESDKTIKKEFEIERSLSIELKSFPKIPIPLPLIPSASKSGVISNASGSVRLSFDVDFGVWINPGSISFASDQKQTLNQCTNIDCIETNITGSWSPSLNVGIEPIACAKIWNWEKCGELTGKGTFSSGVSIGLKHKTQDCSENSGWSGLAKLHAGTGSITVSLGSPDLSWTSPSIKIWDEFEL